MTPQQFYQAYKDADRAKIERVCRLAGTTMANFQQIALAGGSVGKVLAKKLAVASGGEMTALEILYPEDFKVSA